MNEDSWTRAAKESGFFCVLMGLSSRLGSLSVTSVLTSPISLLVRLGTSGLVPIRT